jgi:hypothetical protein
VYEYSVLYICHNQKEIYVKRVDTEKGGEELGRRGGRVSLAPDVMILKKTLYTTYMPVLILFKIKETISPD